MVKFADHTTEDGFISDDNKSAYRTEVAHLAERCINISLALNIIKITVIIVDFRRTNDKQCLPPSHSGCSRGTFGEL